MQIKEKIQILTNIIKRTIKKSTQTSEEISIEASKEIFVLKEYREQLKHSIGLQTVEEQKHEQIFAK